MPDVSWMRVAGFVRQHTHDLRNELNGLDLEAALLADIVTDPEAVDSVRRLRAEIRKVAANLRCLSGRFADPRPVQVRLPAKELFLIWKDQWGELKPAPEVEWEEALGEEEVNVDPSAFAVALRELLFNAHSFSSGKKIRAIARCEKDSVVFELREPKHEVIDPARWGRSPLDSTRRGGYGLGLCEVFRTVEASGGEILWRYDTEGKQLLTTITLRIVH